MMDVPLAVCGLPSKHYTTDHFVGPKISPAAYRVLWLLRDFHNSHLICHVTKIDRLRHSSQKYVYASMLAVQNWIIVIDILLQLSEFFSWLFFAWKFALRSFWPRVSLSQFLLMLQFTTFVGIRQCLMFLEFKVSFTIERVQPCLLKFDGLCWSSAVFVGVRRFLLEFDGFRWSSTIFIGV